MTAIETVAEPSSSTPSGRLARWWNDYWYEPMPLERMAVFSRCIHVVVLLSVTVLDDWVPPHGWAPRQFWQPIAIARWLHIPAPTESTMTALQWFLIVVSVVGIGFAGRTPLRLGWPHQRVIAVARGINLANFAGYFLWLVWAFSWSKVDHDRLTIVVALAMLVVVPGVGRGRDPMVGWALRTVQVVFLIAYPLSAISKIRKSGFMWASQATFARSIIRRGTPIGKWFLNHGQLLVVGQWAFIGFEFAALAGLSRNAKVRTFVLIGVLFLHVFTWATIGIHFLPHTICGLAFLPLERLTRNWSDQDSSSQQDVGYSPLGGVATYPDANG